jgi:hypothetical protein
MLLFVRPNRESFYRNSELLGCLETGIEGCSVLILLSPSMFWGSVWSCSSTGHGPKNVCEISEQAVLVLPITVLLFVHTCPAQRT